jgi:hypothetical protein
MFRMLQVFQRTHGHCRVRENEHPGTLGHWVARQRLAYRNGSLSARRIGRLERLGFVFETTPERARQQAEYKAHWDACFRKLKAFTV